jgi:cytoskeleton protein RodZ
MTSFGENLRRQRELRGISLHEIAEATKIGVRFLRALEEGRLDVLPGGVFQKSFVRQYAIQVGLDPEVVVADFMRVCADPPSDLQASLPARRPLPLGFAFFAVVAVAGVLLSLRLAGVDSGATAAAAREGGPSRSRGAVVAPAPTPAPVVPSTSEPDGLVVVLTAHQSCWVEARADGQPVISRVLREGETETLDAKGEIVLSVGNAGGLALKVNDRPGVSLGRSGEVRRNITITRDNLAQFVDGDATARLSHSS